MAEDSEDDRKQLLDRFLAEIAQGSGNAFFDEDDLVEMYDYASDTNDDYARMELLLCASRLYPTSEAMGERKAYFYYELGNDAAARAAAAQLPESSVLRRLLMLLLDRPDAKTAVRELDNIVDTTDDFEDEWVIQLVDTASDLGLYDWLKRRFDDIKKRSSYPQSFIYELIGTAELGEDYKLAESLAEELTLLEPFNGEFWEMLADIRISHLNEFEKGLSDIDYALAINPGSVKALLLKARALFELDRPTEEILPALNAAVDAAPDDAAPVHYLAMTLFSRGYVMEAINALEDFRKDNPAESTTLEYLTLLCKGHVPDEMLEPIFAAGDTPQAAHWVNIARRFADDGENEAAMTALKAYARHYELKDDTEFYFEMLYRTRRYTEIIELWQRLPVDSYDRTHIVDMLFVMSSLRLKNRSLVDSNIDAIIKRWSECRDSVSYSKRFDWLSTIYFLTSLKNTLDSGEPYDLDTIDPFTLLA